VSVELQGFIRQLHCRALKAGGAESVSDAELLRRFLAGRDEAAFELLVWRHGILVLTTCRRILGSTAEVDDAFQATFLALLRQAGRIRRSESLPGWLHRVARRIAIRARTAGANRQHHERQAAVPEVQPPANAEWSDLGPILDQEIDRLPERFRLPFILCQLQGRSLEEAAQQLRLPKGTLLSRLARAKEKLRFRLSRRGVTLGVAALGVAGLSRNSVSAHLIGATMKTVFSGTEAAIAPAVATLTEGVLNTMFWNKFKIAACVVLTAGTFASGGSAWACHRWHLFHRHEGESAMYCVPTAPMALPVPSALAPTTPPDQSANAAVERIVYPPVLIPQQDNVALYKQAREHWYAAANISQSLQKEEFSVKERDELRMKYEALLYKARILFEKIRDDLSDREAKNQLGEKGRAMDQALLRQASFAAAECYFFAEEYQPALRQYSKLREKYKGKLEELVAITQQWQCHIYLSQSDKANDLVLDFRETLARMPVAVFDGSTAIHKRDYWESWLRTVQPDIPLPTSEIPAAPQPADPAETAEPPLATPWSREDNAHLFKLGQDYLEQAAKEGEVLNRRNLTHEQWQRARTRFDGLLARANGLFEIVNRELRQREASEQLNEADKTLLIRSSFAAAECCVESEQYNAAIRIYGELRTRCKNSILELIAISGLVRCYVARWHTKKEAVRNIEELREALTRIPEDAFDHSSPAHNRKFWEDWLKTQAEYLK
jgi:RNA polymerase sigma factor (sigma-70 family)